MARIWSVSPVQPIVVESLVLEAPAVRAVGGKIIRMVRPDVEGPRGIETDEAQAAIEANTEITNDGNIARLFEVLAGYVAGPR